MTIQGKLLAKHKVPWYVVSLELILANMNQSFYRNIFKMFRVNKA